MSDKITPPDRGEAAYKIVDLNYVSLYYENFQEAIAFYKEVFGPPENVDEGGEIYGW
jgi:predicted enzyme related to lactoylglutathione lyase